MDTFANVQPSQAAKLCRIVSIRPEDYNNPTIFNGQSPLDPQRLSVAIERILRLEPAVLAVDIDTSSPRDRNITIPTTNIPIVWARDASVEGDSLVPNVLLGNRGTDPPYWGFALFPRSTDWTVRNYPRSFQIGSRHWPSLHWAIVTAYCMQSSPDSRCSDVKNREASLELREELSLPVFHFRYRFPTVPLGDLWADKAVVSDNPLKGKIVLLGGYYSPYDQQPTLFGPTAGVELIASAVEGEFSPLQPRTMDSLSRIGWKIALAILIAWIHFRLQPRYALLATMILVSAIVLVGSFIAFRISAYRADFLPFLLGIWIEQLFESAEHAQHESLTKAPKPATRSQRRYRKQESPNDRG